VRIQKTPYVSSLLSKIKNQRVFITAFIFLLSVLSLRAQNREQAADSLFTSFMKRWLIQGASIAIYKEGQVVYRKGLGYRDQQLLQPVQSDTRFRVASISKCFTAAGIMKLVQEHRLTLSQRVFGAGALLEDLFYTEVISDPAIYAITVQNLLEHTAGWDRFSHTNQQGSGDPPFIPLLVTRTESSTNPVTEDALIRYSLRRGLDHSPGEVFAYSNIGYLILGKIIEEVTGETYADFMQQEVFQPMGLSDFVLGKTRLAEQQQRETYYFSDELGLSCYGDKTLVSCAYGAYNIEAMNAHGGWLGTADEICRFVNNLNRYEGPYPLLNEAAVKQMLQASSASKNYAKGWFVNAKGTFWHTGSLDGTASFTGTTREGYCWTFLFNGRGDNSPQFWKELDALPWHFLQLSTPLFQEKRSI
jgi:CubicO group peptidase (beta-lactamase class C family)